MIFKQRLNFYLVFLFCLSLKILASFLFTHLIIIFSLEDQINDVFKDDDWKYIIFTGVFLGPFLETVIFQYLPFSLFKIIKINHYWIRLFVPAMVFGACHYYSLTYIIIATFMGLVLNYFFIFCKDRGKNAVLWVTALHALYNFSQFLIEYIF